MLAGLYPLRMSPRRSEQWLSNTPDINDGRRRTEIAAALKSPASQALISIEHVRMFPENEPFIIRIFLVWLLFPLPRLPPFLSPDKGEP